MNNYKLESLFNFPIIILSIYNHINDSCKLTYVEFHQLNFNGGTLRSCYEGSRVAKFPNYIQGTNIPVIGTCVLKCSAALPCKGFDQ
jgi:hypothetical protein